MNSHIRKAVREMSAYTPGEQPKDPGIVKLNTNENPYPPSPKVAEAVRAAAESLRLYPDPVCQRLRELLARMHGCRVEQVFVGNGSDEVLALCVRSFVEPKGTVGYYDPSYSLYPVLAAIQGVDVMPVPLNAEFTWSMPAGYQSSLFFLANPNAPTSILYPKDVIRQFCRGFHGVVVIDEAYADFSRENCIDLALSLDNVLVARTMSKSYSLAGLRLGYIVGPEPLIQALYRIKDSYNVDRLAQEAAIAAFSDQDHMRRNVEKIKATRERTARALAALGYRVFPSESNFLWVKPPKRPAERVFEDLRARKILVRYFPGPVTGAYLRISIGTDEQIDLLLKALA